MSFNLLICEHKKENERLDYLLVPGLYSQLEPIHIRNIPVSSDIPSSQVVN